MYVSCPLALALVRVPAGAEVKKLKINSGAFAAFVTSFPRSPARCLSFSLAFERFDFAD